MCIRDRSSGTSQVTGNVYSSTPSSVRHGQAAGEEGGQGSNAGAANMSSQQDISQQIEYNALAVTSDR